MKIFDHGDVGIRQITEIPQNAEKVEHNGSFVLAYGEVTGHKHLLQAPPNSLEIKKSPDGFYFSLSSVGSVSHEEHKTLTIPPGTYEVTFEREKDWFENAVRKVID